MPETFLKEEEKEFSRFYRGSVWWVEHRALLRRLGLGALAALDAALLLFVAWTFADTYLLSYSAERLDVAEMAVRGTEDLHGYAAAHAAAPLRAGSEGVISLGSGRYDLYGQIENPNLGWYAEVSYRFRSSQGETPVQKAVVLPGEKKPVASFGVEASPAPRQPALELTDVAWRRVDAHLVGTYDAWAAERLNIAVTDVSFGTDIGLQEGSGRIGRVTFTAKNQSAYSYYDPAFFIRLYRGSTVVGVARTTLTSLDAGETADVAVNWFGTVPDASRVEVTPDINLFDPDVYKPLAAPAPTDRRDAATR